MTKFTIPPLAPSAEERLGHISFLSQEEFLRAATEGILLYRDGYLAGIDAVIALLREPPDEQTRQVFRMIVMACKTATEQDAALRALADELERRKP